MIWYVAYGSNLDSERFGYYVRGGKPPGAQRAVPGFRDPTPPRADRPVVMPGRVFFGWESPTWGGGIAFYDPTAEDTMLGRAYLLTEQQFADLAAQEMHREPGEDLDLDHVLQHRSHTMGPGRYETLHLLGELDGTPMLTFTVSGRERIEEGAAPVPAYLAHMARGLYDAHGLTRDRAAHYLAARPGAGRVADDLIAMLPFE